MIIQWELCKELGFSTKDNYIYANKNLPLKIIILVILRLKTNLQFGISKTKSCNKPDVKCHWCNGYRRRKWTRRYEFKSRTIVIAFYIAQIHFGKVWIQLFSLQLWVNSWTLWVLQPWWGNSSRRRKTEFKPVKLRLKLTSCHILPERRGWVNMTHLMEIVRAIVIEIVIYYMIKLMKI